jgi:hypothetical protein
MPNSWTSSRLITWIQIIRVFFNNAMQLPSVLLIRCQSGSVPNLILLWSSGDPKVIQTTLDESKFMFGVGFGFSIDPPTQKGRAISRQNNAIMVQRALAGHGNGHYYVHSAH